MIWFYNILIYFYNYCILIASLFNKKARLWRKGRKDIFKKIKYRINSDENIVWFHASSLGEFEQGRPVIEAFRKKHPNYKILLTFFSPSGFEVRKNYESADYVFYLPIDSRKSAKKFVELINPKIVFFIKYEFWFNYLNVLSKKKIPVYIISAIFRPEQHFFKWYGGWFRKQLNCFNHFFVQNKESKKLLNSIGYQNVTISGDTRFDRVSEVASQKKSFPLIEQFKGTSELFVAGSTWEPDESLISDLIAANIPNLKFLIAPHEVHPEHINQILKKFNGNKLKFSEANEANLKQANILIIDSIGILLHLYQYSTITYIGGGFSDGIHNILEAATFGNPVIFGPKYQKFQEAKDLLKQGGAFNINNSSELISITKKLLEDKNFHIKTSKTCTDYVIQNKGATEIIINSLTLNF